jgi:hypothetical protein
MIINSLRIFTIILLFAIILLPDVNYSKFFKNSTVQLYLAFIVLIILVLFDNIIGFFLGICLLMLYFKLYSKELKNTSSSIDKKLHECPCENKEKIGDFNTYIPKTDHINNEIIMEKNVLIPFVSEEHLIAAQNNIIDVNNYNMEVLGIQKGYGSQGLNNEHLHLLGYDVKNVSIGSLQYDIY